MQSKLKTKSENSYQNLATFHLVRKTASSFLHNPNGFVTIVLGWVTARILFPSITGHVLGPFIVLPGFLVAIFCLILLLLPSQPWTRLLLLICSGMISDSIVYWCLRAGMGAPIALASLYSKPAIIGSVVTLLLVLSLYALFRAISFDFLSYSHRKVIILQL